MPDQVGLEAAFLQRKKNDVDRELVPTRELVVQVVATAEELTAYMNVTVVGVYGGTNINTQSAAIIAGVDVLVATPGRLLEFLLRGIIKTKLLRQLVIDEVDEMLHLGFRTQLTGILDLLPKKRQNLLFSANMPEDVEKLTHTFFIHPTKIEAAPAGTPLENIDQQSYLLPNFNTKMNMLDWLFAKDSSMTKILVFVSSIYSMMIVTILLYCIFLMRSLQYLRNTRLLLSNL